MLVIDKKKENQPKLNKNTHYEQLYRMKYMVNLGFKQKIQKVQNRTSLYVKDKTCMERFFDFPPSELIQENIDDIIFFKGRFFVLITTL